MGNGWEGMDVKGVGFHSILLAQKNCKTSSEIWWKSHA